MPDSHSSFSESGSSSDMDLDDGNSEEEVVPIALRGNLQKPGPLEDDETRVKWVLDLIQRFCTRRGEEVEAWALAVKRLLDRGPAIDWASTLKQAERVLDRLEKGEFLVRARRSPFHRKKSLTDALNLDHAGKLRPPIAQARHAQPDVRPLNAHRPGDRQRQGNG